MIFTIAYFTMLYAQACDWLHTRSHGAGATLMKEFAKYVMSTPPLQQFHETLVKGLQYLSIAGTIWCRIVCLENSHLCCECIENSHYVVMTSPPQSEKTHLALVYRLFVGRIGPQ